jgi:hypothetical protein
MLRLLFHLKCTAEINSYVASLSYLGRYAQIHSCITIFYLKFHDGNNAYFTVFLTLTQ